VGRQAEAGRKAAKWGEKGAFQRCQDLQLPELLPSTWPSLSIGHLTKKRKKK